MLSSATIRSQENAVIIPPMTTAPLIPAMVGVRRLRIVRFAS